MVWKPAAFAALALCAAAFTTATGEEPSLHERIDRRVAERWEGIEPARLTTDAEFARRLYLDFAGRIPSIAELEAFLAEDDPNKRTALLDRLLAGEEFPRAQAEWLNALLLERRGDDPQWAAFLRRAAAKNLAWDAMVRGMLQAQGDSEEYQGAAYFLTKRLVKEGAMAEVDTPGLARDVGRLFSGVDLQCAQCHDDLYVEDYRQQDFQGLLFVFDNLQVKTGDAFPAVVEKLVTEPRPFMSVFKQQPRTTGPRIPGGEEIPIAVFPEGEEYLVPPDRKTKNPGVPKFSPLQEFAAELTKPDNRLFARNIANRLWFRLMGRGLVEPLDQFHGDNPPSDPVLLELLGDDLAAHGFDLRYFLRELALTETYQRAAVYLQEELPPAELHAVGLERRLSAEQLYWSIVTATGAGDRLREQAEAKEQSDDELKLETELERLVSGDSALVNLQKSFLKTFSNPAREPETVYQPSVESALFLMHDASLLALLEPRPGNLMERCSELDDEAAVTRLFRAILSRDPTEEDRADAIAALQTLPESREAALRNLAWALLASTEFCLNH